MSTVAWPVFVPLCGSVPLAQPTHLLGSVRVPPHLRSGLQQPCCTEAFPLFNSWNNTVWAACFSCESHLLFATEEFPPLHNEEVTRSESEQALYEVLCISYLLFIDIYPFFFVAFYFRAELMFFKRPSAMLGW